MTDNNTSDLPILDDIIKAGDADKATRLSGSDKQPSILNDDDIHDPATQDLYTNAADAEKPGVEAIGEPQQTPGLPDIDALTEDILFSMLPELEQALREKIRHALGRHFADPSDTD